jgi:hypothetical protein
LAEFGETVAVVPSRTARGDEKVLQRDETREPDADLVLGPAELLADLPAGKGDPRERRRGEIGPRCDMGLAGGQEAPRLGGELVCALQHRLGEAQSERHVARVGLQVADDGPVDLDGGTGALVRCPDAPCCDADASRQRRS